MLTPTTAREAIERMAQCRVLVVGDVMLDHFIWGHVRRISPEAPVPIVEVTKESWYPGGAANV
ncbi:MAG: D-glycero-beta-D-manno-heptose-7-phosphate kinase, partial [Prosthecobacter sp.]|nr:D-glycero-beta-D-manno-heptose-7-phosphate kinase [Prosthecobacter sp.]